jgi:hypothetical protein
MGEIAFSPIPPTHNSDGEKPAHGESVQGSLAREYGVLDAAEGCFPIHEA